MKRTLALLGVLTVICQLQADPYVQWVSDSDSSFDVIISGTGLGWTGTIISPSGLWQMHSGNIIQYSLSSDNSIILDNYGSATFLGTLSYGLPTPDPSSLTSSLSLSTEGGYMQPFNPAGAVSALNPMNYGFLTELSFYGSYQNWNGSSSLSITSLPDLNDTSTWTWQAEYKASGQNLGLAPVPEPQTVSIGVLALVLGILWVRLRNRQKPARQRVPIRWQGFPRR